MLPRYKPYALLPRHPLYAPLSKGQPVFGLNISDGITTALAVGKLRMPPHRAVGAIDQSQFRT
jgi:hypothetical protein